MDQEVHNNYQFADRIARLCHSHYKLKLKKTGKPQKGKEWTSLAAILISKSDSSENNLQIVSLATGSKCLGMTKRSSKGDIINDSHAEVLARRAFLRYLYHQLQLACHSSSDVFEGPDDNGRCSLKQGIQFHLYTSHAPCGDASIYPKTENGEKHYLEDYGNVSNKRLKVCALDSITQEHNFISVKMDPHNALDSDQSGCIKMDSSVSQVFQDSFEQGAKSTLNNNNLLIKTVHSELDIFRTGAKTVPGGPQDPHHEGFDYHIVGVVRTKPGRGDPTDSMSCSDKIAKWNVVGLQGALLSHFISKPLFLASVIIGGSYNKEALTRALLNRIKSIASSNIQNLKILPTQHIFEDSKGSISQAYPLAKLSACNAAIIWYNVPGKNVEVCVNGRRQGIATKDLNKPIARCSICKLELFILFNHLLISLPEDKYIWLKNLSSKTYLDCKLAAKDYQRKWSRLLQIFNLWVSKPPSLSQFYFKGK